MISFCITTYNTADTIKEFSKALNDISFEHEIIAVDNLSSDQTAKILQECFADRITIIQARCTRGRGREIAFEKSKGDYVVFLDADVLYFNLQENIEKMINEFPDKFVLLSGKEKSTLMTLVSRKLLTQIGGFPDLNFLEDQYVWEIAKSLGVFKEVNHLEYFAQNIVRQNKTSDRHSEARYEKSFILLMKRRILITRDIIFVRSFNYKELLAFYGTSRDPRGKIITLALYILARFLQFSVKIPSPGEKIIMIKKSLQEGKIT
ncbi:MAG: glycosyltransferase family 2 protein [Thermoplasmatales archaeon]